MEYIKKCTAEQDNNLNKFIKSNYPLADDKEWHIWDVKKNGAIWYTVLDNDQPSDDNIIEGETGELFYLDLEDAKTMWGNSPKHERQSEFRQIADKWHLSNEFLVNILGKSLDTIKTYKYRQLMMPADILVKMRKLDTFLGEMSKI